MLIFVRHGQSEANAAGLVVGRSDSSLTELGRWQAAAVGQALLRTRGPDPKPLVLLTSPLARAVDTAELVASVLNGTYAPAVKTEIDDRLIELDFGDLEGTVVRHRPEEMPEWVIDPTLPVPGGESLGAVAERVTSLCSELSSVADSDDIVLVTHVSPAKAAVSWALDCGVAASWRMSLGLASLTRIDPKPGRPLLVSFNETWHVMDGP